MREAIHQNAAPAQKSETIISVIVPPVVCHNLDPHTGIPFMPHIAAHTVGALNEAGFRTQVIDCFGLNPHNRIVDSEFMLMGVDEEWVVNHLSSDCSIALIYCRTIAEFIAVERLMAALKKSRPHVRIALFENIQAVTSYSLEPVAHEFIGKGCDVVITGEPEMRVGDICHAMLSNHANLKDIDGIVFKNGDDVTSTPRAELYRDLDNLPMPAWEQFSLDGYWEMGFAHAPVTKGSRFLPILTSRGCPYKCTFCIAPEINRKWRYRSAAHTVDEMEYFYRKLGVTDFHISDLNPTVREARTQEFCHELIKRKLPITWKLAQGTKIETIKHEETLELMHQAGCRFISFSPESGSTRMLKIMKKPFDHNHALKMARKMSEVGIRTQAVFIGGVPGEEDDDRRQSVDYARRLIDVGVDEISLVIFTPLPGAALAGTLSGYDHYSACTPSPSWREDYKELQQYRYRMYLTLFSRKLLKYPSKFFAEVMRIFTKKFETKMEMSLYKQVKLYMLRYFPWLFSRVDEAARLHTPSSSRTSGI